MAAAIPPPLARNEKPTQGAKKIPPFLRAGSPARTPLCLQREVWENSCLSYLKIDLASYAANDDRLVSVCRIISIRIPNDLDIRTDRQVIVDLIAVV